MRKSLTQWYKIEYTVYVEGKPTTWYINDYYTQSIRKANNFLKEHPSGKMSIINR